MKYYVNLVQRGISSPTHPVSGKSGKHYGQAVSSPADKGVAFKMSIDQYQGAAHDLIGSTEPNQQWVPEFVRESGDAAPQERCGIPAGCGNVATHIWDRFLYCEEHAPINAVRIGEAPLPKPVPVKVPEAQPTLREFRPPEAKREVLPPPAVGSADVSSETGRSNATNSLTAYPRINMGRPAPPVTQPPPTVAAESVSETSPKPAPVPEKPVSETSLKPALAEEPGPFRVGPPTDNFPSREREPASKEAEADWLKD